MAALIAIVFGLMWWVRTYQEFALLLSAFYLVDNSGWIYLKRTLRPTVESSEDTCKREPRFAELECLGYVADMIYGNWKWWRAATAAAVLVTVEVMDFGSFQVTLAHLAGNISPDFLLSANILACVLTMERWMWCKRIRVRVAIAVTRDLAARIQLVPL